MQRFLLPRVGAACALFLGGLLVDASLAQSWRAPASPEAIRIVSPDDGPSDEVADVLSRGQKFEAEARWGEAISLYEEALREHPKDRALAGRHDLAKIHYDLSRRYHDASFLKALGTLPSRDAMTLYSEVLTKIQTHYVSEPNWKGLIARGMLDLRVAAHDDTFARQNFSRRPSDAELEAGLRRLEEFLGAHAIRNRQEAESAVGAAAQYAQQNMRLPLAATYFEFTCAAAGSLDEYSSYLTSDQLNEVYSQIDGNFVGLGIELKAADGALQIVKVITGSPAEKAGLRAADRITAVDGRVTAEMNTDQAADLLQGVEGSLCRVTVLSPNGQTRLLTVRRAHVEVPSVDDVKIVDRESGVAYLKLTCFQKTTSRDLDTALWKLHREGMRSLVIDLRGNPGGLLTASVEVADKFLTDGKIVSTHGRNPGEDYNYTAHAAGTWQVPLVLLIDGDSASASEILAGAIRDHGRGRIVGERSYGKGSVQGIFPLNVGGAGVRLTTAKFYSPSGAAIARVGVSPNVEVRKVSKPVVDDSVLRFDATDGQASESRAGREALGDPDPCLSAGVQEAVQEARKRTAGPVAKR